MNPDVGRVSTAYGSVAQLVEQPTLNRQAEGSSPSAPISALW